ncbi:MAG: response regulator, partial [Myxococcota bacterium]
CMMPVMDGFEATRKLRELQAGPLKEVPIIALTANTSADAIKRCFSAGMNAHIPKPLQPEDLKYVLSHFDERDPTRTQRFDELEPFWRAPTGQIGPG